MKTYDIKVPTCPVARTLSYDLETIQFMFDVYAAPHDPEARREDCLSVKVYGPVDNPRRLEFFDTITPGPTPTMILCPTL